MKRIAKTILPPHSYEILRRWWHHHSVSRSNAIKLRQNYAKKLPVGVNLFVHRIKNSANTEGRLLQLALESAKIPHRVFDLHTFQQDTSQIQDEELYTINLIKCHPASGLSMNMRLYGIDLDKHYNIGYFAWELTEIPEAFCSCLSVFNEIWTHSTFCTNAIEKKSSVPVLTVPLYADPDRSILQNGRDYFSIDANIFLFMIAYDCDSYVSRKNPQASVEAFLKAFTPEDSHVGLVLKLIHPENAREDTAELLEKLKHYPHIYYFDTYLTDDAMRTLLQNADAYVSLHRSEGFGLLPLEAMALGTPVIATAWSGNMEYMNVTNTALVGYAMTPVNGRYVGSTPGDNLLWAEPDIDEAAAHMRRMLSDTAWREKLIANGRHTANECFTAHAVSKIMRDRLTFLKLLK